MIQIATQVILIWYGLGQFTKKRKLSHFTFFFTPTLPPLGMGVMKFTISCLLNQQMLQPNLHKIGSVAPEKKTHNARHPTHGGRKPISICHLSENELKYNVWSSFLRRIQTVAFIQHTNWIFQVYIISTDYYLSSNMKSNILECVYFSFLYVLYIFVHLILWGFTCLTYKKNNSPPFFYISKNKLLHDNINHLLCFRLPLLSINMNNFSRVTSFSLSFCMASNSALSTLPSLLVSHFENWHGNSSATVPL